MFFIKFQAITSPFIEDTLCICLISIVLEIQGNFKLQYKLFAIFKVFLTCISKLLSNLPYNIKIILRVDKCTAAMEIKCANHLLFNTTFVYEVIMYLYSRNLIQQNLLILSVPSTRAATRHIFPIKTDG